jgi:aspartyl-tRNA(Asn)/glutamyl-tRNA(Gln) amidotransferase subunit B
MELVTEPVIHDAVTAVKFAKELQLLLRYLGAGEANLEKGEMRVEANISVATIENTDAKKFGTKTEVKNLNSFKSVEKAISYEINRQIKQIESGDKVVQETRGWDDNSGKTYSQRLKESSHDYRYFPEPDLPKLKISEVEEFEENNLKKETPELPWVKRERLQKEFGMTDKEIAIMVETPEVGNYFEKVILDKKGIAKLAINYLLTDYLGLIKKENVQLNSISENNFAKLMTMIQDKKLSSRGAKDILLLMIKNNIDPEKIAIENDLIQKSDEGEIKKIIEKIISENPSVVEDYKKGKVAALQFFVGQGMKATKGSANPEILKRIALEIIG